jgi:hypothetical protein
MTFYLVKADDRYPKDCFDSVDYPWEVIEAESRFTARDLYYAKHEDLQEGLDVEVRFLGGDASSARRCLVDMVLAQTKRLSELSVGDTLNGVDHSDLAEVHKLLTLAKEFEAEQLVLTWKAEASSATPTGGS